MERTCSVYAVEGRVFVCPEKRTETGLRGAFAASECQVEPTKLGAGVQRALEMPWPDIAPAPDEVFRELVKRSGMKSARAFYRCAALVSVSADGVGSYRLRPYLRDGRGFLGAADDSVYSLSAPDSSTLGERLLQALGDSERCSAASSP